MDAIVRAHAGVVVPMPIVEVPTFPPPDVSVYTVRTGLLSNIAEYEWETFAVVPFIGISTHAICPESVSKFIGPSCNSSIDVVPLDESYANAPPSIVNEPFKVVDARDVFVEIANIGVPVAVPSRKSEEVAMVQAYAVLFLIVEVAAPR